MDLTSVTENCQIMQITCTITSLVISYSKKCIFFFYFLPLQSCIIVNSNELAYKDLILELKKKKKKKIIIIIIIIIIPVYHTNYQKTVWYDFQYYTINDF